MLQQAPQQIIPLLLKPILVKTIGHLGGLILRGVFGRSLIVKRRDSGKLSQAIGGVEPRAYKGCQLDVLFNFRAKGNSMNRMPSRQECKENCEGLVGGFRRNAQMFLLRLASATGTCFKAAITASVRGFVYAPPRKHVVPSVSVGCIEK